ncbi:MAG TPA: DUF2505 domain-containing protein [Propionibacteriaceae bacterium]|nr:DUF2505 domain-containing protein [Propionibacteriaceae bacterium]
MEIASRQVYNADPTTVVDMFCHPEFLEELGRRSGASTSRVAVAGTTTTVSRTLPAPDAAAKFVGPTIGIVETIAWGDPEPDGGRHGTLQVDFEGLPIQLTGTTVARPDGATTVIEYRGDLTVRIPIIARTVENVAAPAITDALKAQERVGNEWLAARG